MPSVLFLTRIQGRLILWSVEELWERTFLVLLFIAIIGFLFLQHPFVTQLLTRNLVIELLDMANNPELHNTHTHSMDDNELEVSTTRRWQNWCCWYSFASLNSAVTVWLLNALSVVTTERQERNDRGSGAPCSCWCVMLMMCWQVGEVAPDKIQSAGKHLPVERTLSEEQCENTPTHNTVQFAELMLAKYFLDLDLSLWSR